jgi:hypothetical protein
MAPPRNITNLFIYLFINNAYNYIVLNDGMIFFLVNNELKGCGRKQFWPN